MNIIDFFDNCRFWGSDRNPILQKIKFYGYLNFITDRIANFILPVYFRLTENNRKYSLNTTHINKDKECYIVSFTSFPARIDKVWMVVETILRQTYKPDRIILYLSKEQFPKPDLIPDSLIRQKRRGLEIVFCEGDLRSHKKYYYAIANYPKDNIITIDDDIFYRTDLIESFVKEHVKYPGVILANWAKKIVPGTILYNEWPDANSGDESVYMLPIGVGGVLYPPNCFYRDINSKEIFVKNCFKADDIWLSCMSILNNVSKRVCHYSFSHLPVIIRNNVTLLETNRHENQIQIDNLNQYYQKKIGVIPFKNSDK